MSLSIGNARTYTYKSKTMNRDSGYRVLLRLLAKYSRDDHCLSQDMCCFGQV